MRKVYTGNGCNKRGSYIVEATLCLPVFLIAILAMSSIILMYACIEESNYILSDELGRASIEAPFVDTKALVPIRINKRIKDSQSIVKALRIKSYSYRSEAEGLDELIAIREQMHMESANPFDFASSGEYELSCVTRAYVGKERAANPMGIDEFEGTDSDAVFIFPNRGEKFHNKGCNVLHASYIKTILSDALRKNYGACGICRSRGASNGALVYIFPNEGENYHIEGCDTLERNYIEVEKKTAIERGYAACLKCGG